jgi:hypothetical protein
MAGGGNKWVRPMFLWGFPLGAFAATWLYWPLVQGTGIAFPLHLLAVPFIFALVTIRTTTRRLRLWSWRMPLVHLAFLWASYPALGLLLLSDSVTEPFSWTTLVKTVVFSALAGAGVGTLVDVVGMDEDLLEVHHVPKNLGTVKTVLSYSFRFFGIFGALYGASAKFGHYFLVEQGAVRWLPVLILCASVALCLPFLTYYILTYHGWPDKGGRYAGGR